MQSLLWLWLLEKFLCMLSFSWFDIVSANSSLIRYDISPFPFHQSHSSSPSPRSWNFPFTDLLTYFIIHSIFHSFIHSFLALTICSPLNLYFLFVLLFMHWLIDLNFCFFIRSFIHIFMSWSLGVAEIRGLWDQYPPERG